MVLPLKFLIGGLAGGALIATPILVTQLPKSNSEISTELSKTEPLKPTNSANQTPKFQYKDSSGKKIECHGNRSFGLEVGGQTVLWAGERNSVEQANRHQHQSRGTIFEGDKSSCELEIPTNTSTN